MGLSPENKFWLKLETEYGVFDLTMTPWNNAMSSMKVAQAEYGLGMVMEYQGCTEHYAQVSLMAEVNGTAYFQKVCVQAPSPPWFWVSSPR